MPFTFTGYSKYTYYLTEAGNPFINDGTIFAKQDRYSSYDAGAGVNASSVTFAQITNNGSIEGGQLYGPGIQMNAGSVANNGDIAGGPGSGPQNTFFGYLGAAAGGDGVYAAGFVRITNSTYASIGGGQGGATGFTAAPGNAGSGGIGLNLTGGGTVLNQGLIAGGAGGTAFDGEFSGAGGAGIRMYGPGMVKNSGEIIGGKSISALFYGGDGVDLLAGGSIIDYGQISGGANVHGNGGVGVRLDGGTLTVESGAIVSAGKSALGIGSVGVIVDGGIIKTAGMIAGGAAPSDAVEFTGAPSTMYVYRNASFQGAIGGFHYGDTIDLTNLSPTTVAGDFNASTDTIHTVFDGTLQFAGDPTLIFTSDGNGGTLITTPCFRSGTLITTEHGERPIESLAIGDRVLTQDSEFKPVRWIGLRQYSGAALADRTDVLPVLIQAGALGEGLPRRNLWVSPEHAMYFSGALVPASLLTNGISIRTDHAVDSVAYFHLEFDDQEVIFAEGAPAESFVDDDSRRMFDNADDYARRYPDATHKSPAFCAPRIEEGAALERLRTRLLALAGIAAAPAGATVTATPELRA